MGGGTRADQFCSLMYSSTVAAWRKSMRRRSSLSTCSRLLEVVERPWNCLRVDSLRLWLSSWWLVSVNSSNFC